MRYRPRRTFLPIILLFTVLGACQPRPAEPTPAAGADVQIPPLPPPKPSPPVDAVADQTAAFLAGLPCEAPALQALQRTEEYAAYAKALDESWAELEAKRFAPMRDWARAELAEALGATRTLFYPFGGPDILTAWEIFPEASTYILLGLEFVGRLPDLEATSPEGAAAYTQNLLASLSDFFNKSYFITRNMNAALTGDKVDGVLPLLCFFLKRTGSTISAVRRLDILESAEVFESPYPGERKRLHRPYGIKIEFFAAGADAVRSLLYFSADLEDKAFGPETPFRRYLAGLGFETTFVKSASYLMHYREFSGIRDIILTGSRFVLEDDTGVPLRYFKSAVWDARLFGEYIQPVSDFKGVEQADLKAAYAEPGRTRVLPFHLGYHWGSNKDSILYFRKK